MNLTEDQKSEVVVESLKESVIMCMGDRGDFNDRHFRGELKQGYQMEDREHNEQHLKDMIGTLAYYMTDSDHKKFLKEINYGIIK